MRKPVKEWKFRSPGGDGATPELVELGDNELPRKLKILVKGISKLN